MLARIFDVATPVRRQPGAGFIRQWAQRLVPEAAAREHNQALMELGALVCRKAPRCAVCPWAVYCRARHHGTAGERPVKDDGRGMTALTNVAGILEARGRILLHRRPGAGVWAGLWEFPGGAVPAGEEPGAALLRHLRAGCGLGAQILEGGGHIVHTRTRYRITLFWRRLRPMEAGASPLPDDTWRWVTAEELAGLPLPAPHRRLARLALAQ